MCETKEIVSMENQITSFTSQARHTVPENSSMDFICAKPDGPTVVGTWSRDEGTKERKLVLALIYPDGEVSPIHEYSPSKMSPKTLAGLANLDGVEDEDIETIFDFVQERKEHLQVQGMGSGKCSLRQAHLELTEYVTRYMEPDKVFVQNGYGNIEYAYLNEVLNKLELGYTRLELAKNFKVWGFLRVNKGTGHPYTYKISRDWFFSFKLAELVEGGETV